jgi:hypothetical protein
MLDIIIPTLMQSDPEVFHYSLNEANKAKSVNKIFVIDNTSKGEFDFDLPKVQKITLKKNIFVNPAWNLGVNLADSDNILIMNDDIACCENNYDIVDNVLNDESCGLCSIQTLSINSLSDYLVNTNQDSPIVTNETFGNPDNNKTGWFFGLKKKLWKNIPAPIKIIYGDDLIFMRIRQLGFSTKNITNSKIGHLESKTIKKVMNEIIKQVNADIMEYHNLKSFYLEDIV